jgi:hypothetical protein
LFRRICAVPGDVNRLSFNRRNILRNLIIYEIFLTLEAWLE